MTKVLLVLALILLPNSLSAQNLKRSALGWDLTYTSVLNANHIGPGEWIRNWLGPHFQSPIKKYVSGWDGEPIESSILIEQPAFHAAEHVTLWFVRTKSHAYHWELIEGKPPRGVKEALDPALYDKFFAVVSAWQQAKPMKSEDTLDGGIPGYMGFISFYDHGHPRQMLLTLDDFWHCETKKCEGGKGGRLTVAMEIFLNN
jgi:uncharacterized short protein YbdD (DUF466 family)